ncbi:MAG: hypothetical protein PHU71_03390 [Candidatus Gracilibacteria bacterium]|nr:hypothetical protein [Candidatus Gracilibacteria bacterium]
MVRKEVFTGKVGRVISTKYGEKGERTTIWVERISRCALIITVLADIFFATGTLKLTALLVHGVGIFVFAIIVIKLLQVIEDDENRNLLVAAKAAILPISEILKAWAVTCLLS